MAWLWLGKCLHVRSMKDIYLVSTVKVCFLENISPFIPLWLPYFFNIWIEKPKYFLNYGCVSHKRYAFLLHSFVLLETEFFNKFILFGILMLLRDTMTKVTCKKRFNWKFTVSEKCRIWGHYGRYHGCKQTGMILRIYICPTNMRQRDSKLIRTLEDF